MRWAGWLTRLGLLVAADTKSRCLAVLGARLGDGLDHALSKGHQLVALRGEVGALTAVLEATEQVIMQRSSVQSSGH